MKSRYVLPVVALSAVILSSCGGGGGGPGPVTGGGTPGTGEGAARGLPPSVAAWNPWPRDTVELVDWRSRKGYRVTKVTPSGADGLKVTYMAGSRERSIDLERSVHDASVFSRETGDTLVVLQLVDDDFDHFDTGSVFVNADGELSEGYVVFGSRTPAAGLPSGTATYRGKVTAERQYDPSGADPESTHPYSNDVEGDLTLTADLDGGSVQGVIDRIGVRGYYASDFEPVFGARFEIDNGRIEGDAFVADLEGSGAFAGGYTGNVHGVFYGPAAEETGGVLGATRGENDVLIGHFGARPAPDTGGMSGGPADGGGPSGASIAWGDRLDDTSDLSPVIGAEDDFGSDVVGAVMVAAGAAPAAAENGVSQFSLAGQGVGEMQVRVVRDDVDQLVYQLSDGGVVVVHVPSNELPRQGFDLALFTDLIPVIEPDLSSFPHEVMGMWAWNGAVGSFWGKSPSIPEVSFGSRFPTGTATYEGDAVGLHASGGAATKFLADVEMVADFDGYTVGGTVDGFRSFAGTPLGALTVTLDQTDFSAQAEIFSGAASSKDTAGSGQWGARWSDGDGWAMGGTFGFAADDASVGVLGAFTASSGASASDGNPDDPVSTSR